ncbi:MAG: SDR family oxidoreductase [Saprospiraceae bacterium]
MEKKPVPNHVPTAVITGATKGLGRAIAEIFAANGFDLCVCARTTADLEAMQRHWASAFPQRELFVCAADLGNKADVLSFADAVRGRWSRVDVLVNNAGLFLPDTVSGETEEAFELLLRVNLHSAYYLTRALLPLMRPHRQGHVFNMCSIASLHAYPNGASYSISKFALLGFSKALREEMKTEGIRVTALLPGAAWSDSWRGVSLPTDRLMQADDVAKTVWAAYQLSGSAVVEEVLLRPQLGDL